MVAIHKDKDTHITRDMMCDFQNDIVAFVTYAVEKGKTPPPFMRIRLREMTKRRFFCDSSGMSNSKTRNAAHYVLWRCCCFGDIDNPDGGQMVANLSHSFRGARLLVSYIEGWFNTIPFIRYQFKQKPYRSQDNVFISLFKNNSVLRTLPPDIFGNSERLLSERWNVLVIDEIKGFRTTSLIRNIETRANRPWRLMQERYPNVDENILQNHILYLGSASYKVLPIYKDIVKQIIDKSDEGDPDYKHISFNFNDIPEEGGWRRLLVDEKLLKRHREILSKEDFSADWLGIWQDSSDSFYDAEKVMNMGTLEIDIEKSGVSNGIYVVGVDVAGPEGTSDFTITILKILGKKKVAIVYQIRKNKVRVVGNVEAKVETIYGVLRKFPVSILVCDPGGGGGDLMRQLDTVPEDFTELQPVLKYNDFTKDGMRILYPFSSSCDLLQEVLGNASADDVVLGRMHSRLQAAIEDGKILVPEMVTSENAEVQNVFNNIQNTQKELLGIDRKKDASGNLELTARGQYKFYSRGKKDSAYSLLYAYAGALLYQELQSQKDKRTEEVVGGFGSEEDFVEAYFENEFYN